MQWLEHKIPPPLVFLLIALAMRFLAAMLPAAGLAGPMIHGLALLLALTGLAIIVLANLAFRRAQTTPNPFTPAAASTLVMDGIYRYTRNPMYLGLVLLLLALTAYLAAPWLLLGPLFFMLYISRFQIAPEERALTAKFGAAFEQYRRHVRRWL